MTNPTKRVGQQVTVDTRVGNLLQYNYHLDMWAVIYADEPGVYYHISESSMD